MLVMMSAQELANGISSSGHSYAMTHAGRHLTPAADLTEMFGGMEQVLERSSTCFFRPRCQTFVKQLFCVIRTLGEVHEEDR